jgi:hypothetical protein
MANIDIQDHSALFQPTQATNPITTVPNAGLNLVAVPMPLRYSPDLAAPVISNPDPAAESSIDADDTVGFDVQDAYAGLLGSVLVSVLFPGASQSELIYDGAAFQTGYTAGSSASSITNGKRFVIARGAGWYGDFTLTVRAMDPAGNVSTQDYEWSAPEPDPADETAPAFSNAFPEDGTEIEDDETIGLDVTDTGGSGLAEVLLTLDMPEALLAPELVFDGTAFTAGYAAESAQTPITGGYRFRVVRDAGLYGEVTLTARATDAAGNVMSPGGYAWEGPEAPPAGSSDPSAPQVALVSPAEGTAISRTQAITLDVTDVGLGLRRVLLLASFESMEAPELVHDGNAFSVPYVASSTREAIAGGFRYVLLRNGGWPDAPTLTAHAFDQGGNEAT